jgi:hypothetical protein
MICGILFAASFLSAFGIASLVIGIKNPHSEMPCMQKDKTGLYLDEWMIGKGIADIGGISILLILLAISRSFSDGRKLLEMFLYVWAISFVLFQVIWWIMGVVILSRSSGACLSEGTDPGIMTLITLIMFGF